MRKYKEIYNYVNFMRKWETNQDDENNERTKNSDIWSFIL